MSDDFVSLKVLVVSDSGSEREAIRNAASHSSAVVEIGDSDRIADRSLLANRNVDVIFLDSRLPLESRQTVLEVARAAPSRPLVISVGLKPSPIAAEVKEFDGAIAKPVQASEMRAALDACTHLRRQNRILVVDDSPTMRSVIRKVLHSCRHSFEVEEAGDGAEALSRAAKQRFDLVMLDCNMKGLDGFATLGMFRQTHPTTKVVMITASSETKTADRARVSGAHDVLQKPFYGKDVDALMNRLYGLMRPKLS
jgi:CheY-like chemotaxis protein